MNMHPDSSDATLSVDEVRVDLRERGYPIYVGEGLYSQCGSRLRECGIDGRICLVSTPPVFDLYGGKVMDSLAVAGYDVVVESIPDGEETKSLATAERLYDRALASGLDRTSAYITNLLFWRPPGNRTPTVTEISACLPFVERHIELADPQYLLLAGGISAKTLLGRSQGILKLRGHWAHYQHAGMARPIPALASLHPAYLLRQPGQKRLAWRDLLSLREALDSGRDPLLTPKS